MSVDKFIVIFPFWIKAFVLTLVLEIPVFVFIGKRLMRKVKPVSWQRFIVAGALGTCITHPLLWFAWPLVMHDYTTYLITGELLVAVIESVTFYLVVRGIRFRDAALASFAANGVSLTLGILIQYFIY